MHFAIFIFFGIQYFIRNRITHQSENAIFLIEGHFKVNACKHIDYCNNIGYDIEMSKLQYSFTKQKKKNNNNNNLEI